MTRRYGSLAMSLELKEECERCGARLDHGGTAFICSYECTFCGDCAAQLEHDVPQLRR